MSTFVTTANVRSASGIPVALLSDADLQHGIDWIEKLMERFLNTKFAPTYRIDMLDGNKMDRIFTDKNPVLTVRSLTSNGDSVTPADLNVYRESGKVVLSTDAQLGTLVTKDRSVIIGYYYGMVEESTTSTTLSVATAVGTSVTMTVGSSTGFAAADWVDIYGTDGHKEAALITGTGTGTITVDQLVYTHAAGSIIIKLECPYSVKRYIEVECCIYAIMAVVGAQYSFNSSYTLGNLSVTRKPIIDHYEGQLNMLLAEREQLRQTLHIRPHIVI